MRSSKKTDQEGIKTILWLLLLLTLQTGCMSEARVNPVTAPDLPPPTSSPSFSIFVDGASEIAEVHRRSGRFKRVLTRTLLDEEPLRSDWDIRAEVKASEGDEIGGWSTFSFLSFGVIPSWKTGERKLLITYYDQANTKIAEFSEREGFRAYLGWIFLPLNFLPGFELDVDTGPVWAELAQSILNQAIQEQIFSLDKVARVDWLLDQAESELANEKPESALGYVVRAELLEPDNRQVAQVRRRILTHGMGVIPRAQTGQGPIIAVSEPGPGEELVYSPRARLVAVILSPGRALVDRVQILVNGKPEETFQRDDAPQSTRVRAGVQLELGANRIEIIAADSDGHEARREIELIREKPRGRVYAVVIGINDYEMVRKLRYARQDAEAVRDHLIKTLQVPEDNVHVLLDEQATTGAIRSEIGDWLAGEVRRHDKAFIYFAGHGFAKPDRESSERDGIEKFMLPVEARTGQPVGTAISMTDFAGLLGRVKARSLVVVLDACYSGSAEGDRTVDPGIRGLDSAKFLEQMAKGEGRLILSASGVSQPSQEKEELEHGVFTYFFLEALAGPGDQEAGNRDGWVSVREAFDYARSKVIEKTGNQQVPTIKGTSVEPIPLGYASVGQEFE